MGWYIRWYINIFTVDRLMFIVNDSELRIETAERLFSYIKKALDKFCMIVKWRGMKKREGQSILQRLSQSNQSVHEVSGL